MTTPETPQEPQESQQPQHALEAQPEAAASQPHDHDRAPARGDDDPGPQPGNVATSASSGASDDRPAHGNAKDAGDGDDAHASEAGEASEGAGTSGEGGENPGTPGAPGTAKRRRRRRKRGGGGAGAGAAGVEGAPHGEGTAGGEGESAEAEGREGAEGAAAGSAGSDSRDRTAHAGGSGTNKKSKRPPRPDRERPAFNMGDVVFGKILEVTDECLKIDLSGKANAIFDLRELLLPVDDDNEPAPPEPEDGKDDDATHEASAASEAPATTEAEPAGEPTTEAAVEGARAAAPEAEATEPTPTETAPAAEAASETANASEAPASSDTSEASGTSEASDGETPHKDPPLPQVILQVGAQFVGVVHNDGGRGGWMVLTHHPKRASKAKVRVAQALKDHSLIEGLVTGVIKGGIEVDVDGLRAFVPGSHMALHLGADLTPFIAKRLEFYVTQYAKRGRDVVLSRKPLLEAEARQARELALATLQVGAEMEGTVRSVVPFGAFVDVGGIEGLVPLQEMSHNRSDSPSDIFKAGEKTQVKVLKIDDKGKVWLSRKATIADPWGEVAKKYAVGTKHAGKVVRIQPFGAFVELESGIDGLIHAADMVRPEKGMSGMKRVEDPNEVVKVGDEAEVVVAHLDLSSHKIGLHFALGGALVDEEPQKVVVYKMVKAVVVGVEAGGLFMRLRGVTGRNARAYITAAATGTARGTELRKPFPVGKEVEAKVLEIDPKAGEAKLSIKALAEESERSAYNAYRAQVKTAAKFTFGDLLAKKGQKQK
jgi:small subunit ribosomal protein S1